MKRLVSSFLFILVFCLTLSAGQQKPVRILFVGNSHTVDATDLLPPMLNGCGVENIELTRVYRGGYWLQGFWKNYATPDFVSVMTWKPGQLLFRGTLNHDFSLQQAVEAGPYDIVVLSEYPGLPYAWTWTEDERAAAAGLVSKVKEVSPGAKLYFYLSHCMGKGHKKLVAEFDNDNKLVFARAIEENAKHIMDPAEGFGFERLISCAALVQNLRTTGLNKTGDRDLFRGDAIHMDYGLTRVAGALLFWKVLITPITGIQPEDTGFRYNEFYPNPNRYTTPVTDAEFPVLIAAVNAAYEHPMEITDMSTFDAVPDFSAVNGAMFLNTEHLKVEPVTFPVEFKIGILPDGQPANALGPQPHWMSYGIWLSSQQQAYAKWVPAAHQTEENVYFRDFKSYKDVSKNMSSIRIQGIHTGDYMEFVIPVQDFKAGTALRFDGNMSYEKSSCSWQLDYLDGGKWRSCNVSAPMVFTNAVESGFLHIRLRCKNAAESEQSGSRVHLCFYGSTAKAVSFSIK